MKLVVNENPDLAESREMADRQLRFTMAGLVGLTEKMLLAAEQRQWDLVEELEFKRRRELDGLKARGAFDDMAADVAEAFAILLSINEKISWLVEKARLEIMDEYGKGKSRNQAASYYTSR